MIQLKKILYPTDFGESAEQALRYAVMLGSEYKAELILMNVVSLFGEENPAPEARLTEMEKSASGFTDQLHQDAHQRIDRTIEDHREHGLKMRKLIVRGFSPYQEILRVINEENIDLVIMGTYGRGGMTHFLFGSTNCPLASVVPVN